jgi:hypothetical protein
MNIAATVDPAAKRRPGRPTKAEAEARRAAGVLPRSERPRRPPVEHTPVVVSAALAAVLSEDDINVRVIPLNTRAGPRDCRAHATLERLCANLGPDHVRLVLTAIVSTHPANDRALSSDVLYAVSDLAVMIGERVDGDILARLDGVDLAALSRRAGRLAPVMKRRHAVTALLADRLGILDPLKETQP